MARSALIAAGRVAAAPPSAISPDTCGGERVSALRTIPSAGSVACALLQLPGGQHGVARAPVVKERSARLVTGAREARNREPIMLVTLLSAQRRDQEVLQSVAGKDPRSARFGLRALGQNCRTSPQF